MTGSDKRLLILAENPLEQIWANLSIWESVVVARKTIQERALEQNISIEHEMIEKKGIALSYCLRNARENLKNLTGGYTQRAIANYYGCMWFTSAMLVADPSNNIDLEKLEKFTKFGHGLGNIVDDDGSFPGNELIYVKQSGFFYQYILNTILSKADANSICFKSFRAQTFNEVDQSERHLLVNFLDLLARIAEIKDGFEYVTGERSLIFAAFDMPRNKDEDISDATERGDRLESIFPQRVRDYTWLGVAEHDVPEDFVRRFGPPLEDLALYGEDGKRVWCGKFKHPAGERWWTRLKPYRSAMAPTCWVNPIFGKISDPAALHLMVSYQISIMARYRPAVWREIIEGRLDSYRALIDLYNNALPRLITELVLRSIAGRRIKIVVPGAFTAPI